MNFEATSGQTVTVTCPHCQHTHRMYQPMGAWMHVAEEPAPPVEDATVVEKDAQ